MLCDDCKKRQACVHITKIANNQKIDKHLCEYCAKESGDMIFSTDHKFSVHDFLKGMFSNSFVEAAQPKVEACANCGMTYRDFSRNGKIGCSTCYSTFGSKLEPLLRRIHGSSTHTGKIPKRSGESLEIRQRIKRMRHELEKYVEKEEFESAAKLRDEIRLLERELNAKE
ncbi:UvrB/UvrC motif-containing protein [Dendrosporobacter sp. 1207_IL3150]|uniref:UvrB/UvrC motif-containing protein n=1 Tax=Dendrosporobacter sp. 1207_IL3150 TaxID=3084054 RepID=UPI002FD9FFD3